MRQMLKSILGGVMSRSSGLQNLLLKAATFPRFHAWMEEDGSALIPGTGRDMREGLYARVVAETGYDAVAIQYWEFGVHEGGSFKWWLAHNTHPDSQFHGFDSFEGLPEAWLTHKPAGTFSTGGKTPPIEDPRGAFHRGWFHQTLPGFLKSDLADGAAPRVFHMDADLYRSTIYVLMNIGHLVRPGDVMIFDEMWDSIHEFRAFEDFINIFGLKYRSIAHTTGYGQVGLQFI